MSEFASRWPDVRLWAITQTRAAIPGVKVSAERDEDAPKQVVVSVVPQQAETAVSRFYLVTFEGWDSVSKSAALEMTGAAAFAVESSPRNGSPLVRASLNAGPNEVRDPSTGIYNYEAVVLVSIHRLP